MCAAAAATAAAAETQIMCQSVYRGGGGGGEETAAAAARTPRNIANTEGMQEASQEKSMGKNTKEPRKQQVQIKRTTRKNESSTSKAEQQERKPLATT